MTETSEKKTTKVRRAFTLDEDIADALDDFSSFAGQSRSGYVNSCLRDSLPHLKQLTEVMIKIRQNPTLKISELHAPLVTSESIESTD